MLELRPSCEGCDLDLPPESTEAMICTYEGTFCRDCVTGTLSNVCPNCGGGFCPRPNRPRERLGSHPPSGDRKPPGIDRERHARFLARYGKLAAEDR